MLTDDGTDWNRIYTALAHEDRRSLLQYLLLRGNARVEEVARSLLDKDEVPNQSEIDRVLLLLHHVHLPKLADAGLLAWDYDRDYIVATSLASQLPAETIMPRKLPPPGPDDMESAV